MDRKRVKWEEEERGADRQVSTRTSACYRASTVDRS